MLKVSYVLLDLFSQLLYCETSLTLHSSVSPAMLQNQPQQLKCSPEEGGVQTPSQMPPEHRSWEVPHCHEALWLHQVRNRSFCGLDLYLCH